MRPRWASPSMVSTLWPAAAETGTEQERTGSPFRCTVQAPHWAMPQPNLGPFTSSTSRNTQSKGISGSTSALRFLPLTVSSIIWDLLGLSVMQYCKSRFSWCEQFTSSNEAQPLVRERQRADALAGRGEDRVAQRRGERRERRLAQPAPEPAARNEDRLDVLRHLGEAHDAVVVEVGLLDAALPAACAISSTKHSRIKGFCE